MERHMFSSRPLNGRNVFVRFLALMLLAGMPGMFSKNVLAEETLLNDMTMKMVEEDFNNNQNQLQINYFEYKKIMILL